MTFELHQHHELMALFRAVVEAKFQKVPVDDDLPASAVLAGVAERLRDTIVAAEREREGDVAQQRWHEWGEIGPERREWGAALCYAARAWRSAWPNWGDEERERACRALLSPFFVDAAVLARFAKALQDTLERDSVSDS